MPSISFSHLVARAAQGGALRLSKKPGGIRLAVYKGNIAARVADRLRGLSASGRANADLRKQFLNATKRAYGYTVVAAVEQRLGGYRSPTLSARKILDLASYAHQVAVDQVFSEAGPVNVFSVLDGRLAELFRGEARHNMVQALRAPEDAFRASVKAALQDALKPWFDNNEDLSDEVLERALASALMTAAEQHDRLLPALQNRVAVNFTGLVDATIGSLGCSFQLAAKRKDELAQPSNGLRASVLAGFAKLVQRRFLAEAPAEVTTDWLDTTLLSAFRTAFYAQAMQQPTLLGSVLRSPVIAFGPHTRSLAAEMAQGMLPPRGCSPEALKRFAQEALSVALDLWDRREAIHHVQPAVTGQQQAALLLKTIMETRAHELLDGSDKARLSTFTDKVNQATRQRLSA